MKTLTVLLAVYLSLPVVASAEDYTSTFEITLQTGTKTSVLTSPETVLNGTGAIELPPDFSNWLCYVRDVVPTLIGDINNDGKVDISEVHRTIAVECMTKDQKASTVSQVSCREDAASEDHSSLVIRTINDNGAAKFNLRCQTVANVHEIPDACYANPISYQVTNRDRQEVRVSGKLPEGCPVPDFQTVLSDAAEQQCGEPLTGQYPSGTKILDLTGKCSTLKPFNPPRPH